MSLDDSKKGVGPAYPMQPTAPYAVMQGPQLHPSGAPPTYSMMHQTMQPPGHYQEQPMQPYITGDQFFHTLVSCLEHRAALHT